MYVKRKTFIFKDFDTGFQYLLSRLFGIATFSEHILPTAYEYSMFLTLTKIKNQNIEVIGDIKSVLNRKSKSKLVKL